MRRTLRSAGFLVIACFTCAAAFPQTPVPAPRIVDPTHNTTTSDVAGIDAASSKCPVSDDETYGFTVANPIKTGGGVAYGPDREVKYLAAIRGANGQGLHFQRNGSLFAPNDVILDKYDLQEGDRHYTIYIDESKWEAPRAPKGLSCGLAIALTRPGPDPFEVSNQARDLGIELASSAELPPISLDGDGSSSRGAIFDYVRIVQRAARLALAQGKPLDSKALPRDLLTFRLVVFANPLNCAGKVIAAESATLVSQTGASPHKIDAPLGQEVATLVPGYTPAPGAIAISYATSELIPNSHVTIHYAESCGGLPQDMVMPLAVTSPRVVRMTRPAVPAGITASTPVSVMLQAYLGFDGKPRFPAYVSGPEELADAAIAALGDWQVEAPRVNGAPVMVFQRFTVTFVAR